MGNICRSPSAEGVFRAKVAQAGLSGQVQIDSAGTHAYHEGSPPDERAVAHALQRGIDLSTQRARKVRESDFQNFDLVVAMDWDNLALLQAQCPPEYAHKLRLMMSFAPPEYREQHGEIIPDPYYGGAAGFDKVLDLLDTACAGLTQRLVQSA
jgi:protein-tyrosine phosphatase